MNGKPILLFGSTAILVALCALATAAMSAAASAANGVAFAVTAAALQTSQCTIGVLALGLLFSPVVMMFAFYLMAAIIQRPAQIPPGGRRQDRVLERVTRPALPDPEDAETMQIAEIIRQWSTHE